MKQTIFDNQILIVDDSAELRTMLQTFLMREGFQKIVLAEDCRSAFGAMKEKCPDFIILDVNLPDGDGFSLMRRLRQEDAFRSTPVLFLSARDKDADRLTGLGLGADDYMVKPFLPKELLLRMSAILKRSYSYVNAEAGIVQKSGTAAKGAGTQENWSRPGMEYGYFSEETEPLHVIMLGGRRVDFDAGTAVRADGSEERLTVKELKILETLAKSRGKIVTFDNLCKAVWNAQYYTYENTVMVHIRRLREKIEEDPSHPKWLVTARGIGYKLENSVHASAKNI